MKRSVVRLVGCAALLAVAPTAMYAHFRLLEPASWLVEDARGDPQKAGPCGGTHADWGKPSYVVSKVTGEHGANNPGNYTYHLCADLQITADPAKPIDTQWPAERQSSAGYLPSLWPPSLR
jgi:hypothetical protein